MHGHVIPMKSKPQGSLVAILAGCALALGSPAPADELAPPVVVRQDGDVLEIDNGLVAVDLRRIRGRVVASFKAIYQTA